MIITLILLTLDFQEEKMVALAVILIDEKSKFRYIKKKLGSLEAAIAVAYAEI